jgi:hypothetical protein
LLTLFQRMILTVVDQFEKHAPPAAKALIDSGIPTALLKPRPFKTNSNRATTILTAPLADPATK